MTNPLLALLLTAVFTLAAARPVGAIELALENGWVATSDEARAEAFVDEGIVYLKGTIANGSSAVLFTLPPSLRPAAQLYVTVGLSSFLFGTSTGRLWIRPDGVAVVQPASGNLADATPYTSLDGAKFALSASGFTPLPLVNGWVGAPFSTSEPAATLIDGIVHLKGGIASGTLGEAFTLPPAMRPTDFVFLKTTLCDAAAGTLLVAPSGVVSVSADDVFTDAQCFTSLDGASFAPSNGGFATLPLLNDWAHGPGGTSDAAVSMVDGIVHFRGAVGREAFGNSLAFVLPPEMSPSASITVPIGLCGGDIGKLLVEPNGEGHVLGGNFGYECRASLDGVSYVAAPPRTFRDVGLLNGWTNGLFATPPAAVVLYDGVVHFRGAITNGTTDHLFTLPVTLRPESNVYVATDLCSGKPGRLLLQPSGHVFVQTESGIFGDAQCFTSLEGVKYAPYSTAFTPLSLVNGWGDMAFGTSRASAARIDGMVHLKGGIAGGTDAGLFTLPPAMRPAVNVFVPVGLCGAVKGRLLISPSGLVEVLSTTTFATAQCFTSLDGVSFATSTNGFAPLPPSNGWTHTPYGTHAPAATIVRDIAYLEGAIVNGASAGAFVLPPILRPVARVYESVDLVAGRKGRVIIEPTGEVSVFALGSFSDAQGFTSFDGVSYSVPEPAVLPGLISGVLLLVGVGRATRWPSPSNLRRGGGRSGEG